jgi:thioredoxin reductase
MDLKVGLVEGASPAGTEHHSLIIAGGGPAGLSASLYAARYDIDHIVLESWKPGGQAALTAEIENYPGVGRIAGADLTRAMKDQALNAGAVFRMESVEMARDLGDVLEIKLNPQFTHAHILSLQPAPHLPHWVFPVKTDTTEGG